MYRGFSPDTRTHLEFCPIGNAAYGAVIRAALTCTNHLRLLSVLKNAWNYSYSSVAQQPKRCLRRLAVDVTRSQAIRHIHTHTHTHTHTVGLLWTSDQLVAEAATYTTHYKHKRRTSVPSAGLEPTILAIKRLQIYTLDRTATGIGVELYCLSYISSCHDIPLV